MEFETCTPTLSRKNWGNATGKIYVASSYGRDSWDNDDWPDVTTSDCPTGYKTLKPNNQVRLGTNGINERTVVPIEDIRTDGWRGGNTCNRGAHGPNITNPSAQIANSSGAINQGVHGAYDCQSDINRGWGRNNWARPCYKDASGWQYTNPVNGHRRPHNPVLHQDQCCGFDKNTKDTVDTQKYCDPRWCYKKPDSSENEKISRECRTRLLEKCRKWSWDTGVTGATLGFDDTACMDGQAQEAKKINKHRSELSNSQRQNAAKNSMSISESDYISIGRGLCRSEDIINRDSRGNNLKKHNACKEWCKHNHQACAAKIQAACRTIYNRARTNPDTYGGDIESYDNICACNWPQEFYDNIIDWYVENFRVDRSTISPQRKCLYRPCGTSAYRYYNSNLVDTPCGDQTFVSCVQNLNIDLSSAAINGQVNVTPSQQQQCGTLGDTGLLSDTPGASSPGGVGAPSPESTDGEDSDDKKKKILLLLIVFVLIISFGYAAYEFDLI